MKKFAVLAVTAMFFVLAATQSSFADEKYHPFPLNHNVSTDSFSGNGLFVSTFCTVNKNDENELYSYSIVVKYKTDKNMLLSWNFLDWILGQYTNAMREPSYAVPNLFPLNIGEGNYTFRFKSTEAPLWFQNTLMQIFPYETPNAREQELNKEVAEEWSGVSVSSYNYINVDIAQDLASCLPSDLLVFPNSTRSGF